MGDVGRTAPPRARRQRRGRREGEPAMSERESDERSDPLKSLVRGWTPPSTARWLGSAPSFRSARGPFAGAGFDSLAGPPRDASLHFGVPSSEGPGASGEEGVVYPEPGAALAGFRIVSELGRGAFARVYLAEQLALSQRMVALKVARALGDEPQALARFQHTHIVPIHSVHDDPATGLRLLCMPYFGGANLAQLLTRIDVQLPTQATGKSLVEALDRAGGPLPLSDEMGRRRSAARGRSVDFPGGRTTQVDRTPSARRSRWERHGGRFSWLGTWDEGSTQSLEGAPDPGQPARQFLRAHSYV